MAPILYVTRGLPGSGKSHWAKAWVAEAPDQRARVNRDCLRDMLAAGCYRMATEAAVTKAAHGAVRALLLDDWDVVCDDTNLRPEVIAGWRALAAEIGARLEVIDLTAVPVETCIERDARRSDRGYPPERWDGARTGEAAIRGMARRYLGVGGMVSA